MRYPKMCHHKKSGRAFVVVADGSRRKQVYLGAWGSAEAKANYDAIIARLAVSKTRSPISSPTEELSFAMLVKRYMDFAATYYAGGDTAYKLRFAFKVPVRLYGRSPVSDFGPKALATVMDAWVASGLSRKEINARSHVIKRMFAWAVAEELIPVEYHQRLKVVGGLKAGRTTAPDLPPVEPAKPADVAAVLDRLPPAIAAITRLMIHSGARCGELCKLRAADIDMSGAIWTYRPTQHKGTWKGKVRTIYFGRVCREVMQPYLAKAGDGYLFCPRVEEAERNARRSANRITPLWESHKKRNESKRVTKRAKPLGERYKTQQVGKAIKRACAAVGIDYFTPHQLRHLAATTIRADPELGIEVARAVLGHSIASMTELYSSQVDGELAKKAAEKLG